jgi:cellulose synthase/poly-beta-1,6-N-acetylglucosamine synthase-like glycosyltransferase
MLLNPNTPLALIILYQLMLMPLAFDLGEMLGAWVGSEQDLPHLAQAVYHRRVAVLILICNDVVPEALEHLEIQTYPGVDYFILDDSDQPTDACNHVRRSRIVRRGHRTGNKAGNLNYWLRGWGEQYDYFVVLDSDSILPASFVEQMVRYADHPANGNVGIFNSLTECWNTQSSFVRRLTVLAPLHNWIRIRLANLYSSVLSQGHNNLHRTSALLSIGGFDERFIAEDIAVTLALHRAGFSSKVVKVISFEGEPETITGHTKRLARWAKQNIDIQRADWPSAHFDVKFQMFRLLVTYASAFLLPAWSFGIAWMTRAFSYPSHLAEQTLSSALFLPWVLTVSIPILVVCSRLPAIRRIGIPVRHYVQYCFLAQAVACSTMFPLCWAQISGAATEGMTFAVTPKRNISLSFISVLARHWHLLSFVVILLVASLWSRVAVVFFAPYLLTLLSAPFVIYWCSTRPHGTKGP